MKVSVLFPCYNAAGTLDDALRSLAEQTYDNFEIVAVDDGSTDDSGAILAAWAGRDPRLRVFSTPHRGIVGALQTAAQHARAPVLVRMDADDTARLDRLEAQLGWLDTHPDAAACGALVRYFPRHILRDGARRYENWINRVVTAEQIDRDMFVECPIPHPTLAVRRQAFDAVGGYRAVEWPEDYDLVLRLWQAGFGLGKVEATLVDWREGPSRLSRLDPRYAEEAFVRCKAHYLAARLGERRVVVWGAGPIGKAIAAALRSQGVPIAAFVDVDPRKVGQRVSDIPVVAREELANHADAYVLAAVGAPGARDEIRAALREMGRNEPDSFCAVA